MFSEWIDILLLKKKPESFAQEPAMVGKAFTQLIPVWAILALIATINSYVMLNMPIYKALYPNGVPVSRLAMTFGWGFLQPIIGLFIYAIVIFVCSKLLGGQGSFLHTLGITGRISAAFLWLIGLPLSIIGSLIVVALLLPAQTTQAAMGSLLLFGLFSLIIGVVSLIVLVWQVIVLTKAIAAMHKISGLRAAVGTVIVPVLLIGIVFLLLLIIAINTSLPFYNAPNQFSGLSVLPFVH